MSVPKTEQFHTRLTPAVLDNLRKQASERRWSAALLGAVLIEEGLEKMAGGSLSATLAAPVTPALEATDEVIIGRSIELAIALGISSNQARKVIRTIMLEGPPFRDILTADDARAIPIEDWLKADATKLVMERLFPAAKWAHAVAHQNQTARYNRSRNREYHRQKATADGAAAPGPPTSPPGLPDMNIVNAAGDIAAASGIHGRSIAHLRTVLANLPDVRDLQSATALGYQAWIAAGASRAVIEHLFPGDDEASRLASRAADARSRAA